ncbi:hypothetical protein D3C81_1695250 [compost metagenome]
MKAQHQTCAHYGTVMSAEFRTCYTDFRTLGLSHQLAQPLAVKDHAPGVKQQQVGTQCFVTGLIYPL